MFKFPELVLAVMVMACGGAAAQEQRFPGIGRAALGVEVAAWDIDVRPDFKGLPVGSGSVRKGQEIWEAKCAQCHGVFGESNEVFGALVGGTSKRDVASGRVESLSTNNYTGRTTLMKVATVSTLWDYINRAMPWNNPKTLTTDEVYAVTAFMLHLGNILPENHVLSDKNIAQAQDRMPNRNGMSTAHAMWPGQELGGLTKPDVSSGACMTNCVSTVSVSSQLPDYARNAHGNLGEQSRAFGAQVGVDTTKAEVSTPLSSGPTGVSRTQAAPLRISSQASSNLPSRAQTPPANDASAAVVDAKKAIALAAKYSCSACHGAQTAVVGPGFAQIGKRHFGKTAYLLDKVNAGGVGVWGSIPMPAQTLPKADAARLAQWLAAGAPRE